MTLNDILLNDKLNSFLEECINKTYHKYRLFTILEKDDFFQDTCIFIMNRIKNFDSEKSTIKTYLPIMVMTCARQSIRNATGQSKENDKLKFKKDCVSLDVPVSESGEDFYTLISDKNYDLEMISMNKLLVEEILQSDFLTERQREILYYLSKDYSIKEISNILECSYENINYHIRKAKNKILLKYKK